MSIELLISVDPCETRVATLVDGRVADIDIEREDRVVGNIYLGRVENVVPAMDAAFVDIGLDRNAFVYVNDVHPSAIWRTEHPVPPGRAESIAEILRAGDELLVQVARPGVGSKGPRVKCQLSLVGRYCVLLVGRTDVNISRRVTDETERQRLARIAPKIRPLDYGLILRTEAEGHSEADLATDIAELESVWTARIADLAKTTTPALVYREPKGVERIIRDYLSADVTAIRVDQEAEYEHIRALVSRYNPGLAHIVRLETEAPGLFERYGVEAEIHRALSPVVELPRGGWIRIDQTEALTSIDVNTGSDVHSHSARESILNTNLEAVTEVCRQLRLRDIGGVIVIDFIDMDRVKDRITVMDILERALHNDPMRTRIVHLSPLGLVEMTRRRRGRSLAEVHGQTCPYCQGTGQVLSPLTVAIETRRQLLREASPAGVRVLLHPDVAAYLVGDGGTQAQAIEERLGCELHVMVDHRRHVEFVTISPAPADALAVPTGATTTVSGALHPPGEGWFARYQDRLLRVESGLDDAGAPPRVVEITGGNRWYLEGRIVEDSAH